MDTGAWDGAAAEEFAIEEEEPDAEGREGIGAELTELDVVVRSRTGVLTTAIGGCWLMVSVVQMADRHT